MTECAVCGVTIPLDQASLCSVCYGDPGWGADGLLRARLEEQGRAAERDAQAAEAAAAQERLEHEYDPGVGE